MSLRLKLVIAMVALAAASTTAVGAVSYFLTKSDLRSQIDASLHQAAGQYLGVGGGNRPVGLPTLPGSPTRPMDEEDPRDQYRNFTQILVQIVDDTGAIVRAPRTGPLPVGVEEIEVAAGGSDHPMLSRDVAIDGEDFRMLTVETDTGAVQFARSLAETNDLLASIRNRTLILVAGMSALALLIGMVIAQQVTRRLMRLTDVATAVAESGDLDITVPVDGTDETGRLGQAFDRMLSSLARSRRAQHQLVQDAGHELRTPLTSLRTNVAVMQRYDELSPPSRQRLLVDMESETRELTTLVNELVELATDRRDDEPRTLVAVGPAVEVVVDRARRRSARTIALATDGTVVDVRPAAFERAVSNLIENALKFSDGAVEVTVAGGRVDVADRGPGIAADDLPKVFDRFYRSDDARALPGSGLGLAIVRDMVESHGGSVHAESREGGGLVIGFTLPVVAAV